MSAGALAERDLGGGSRRAAMSAAGERVSPALLAVAALTVLAAVLRFYRLGHQGFWFDEAYSDLLVHFSPGQMLGLLPHTESTPPLYYCVAWVWVRIFGFQEAGLRSLSALAGTALVPVFYGIGATLATRRIALTAAALAATNPLLVWYSQEARSYALVLLFCAVSFYAFARIWRAPERRWLGVWALFAGLALATHYYAIVTVVPQAIGLLIRERRSVLAWSTRIAVAFVAAVGAALIPLALAQHSTKHDSWIAPIPLLPRIEQVGPQFLLGPQWPLRLWLELGAELIAVAAIGLTLLRAERLERRAALIAAALTVGGIALNLALIAVGVDNLITRNTIVLWLPAALLIACGLGARRAGVVGLGAAALLCLSGVYVTLAVAQDRSLQRPDWRYVARALGPRPAPGQPARAFLIQRYRYLLPLSLYMSGLGRLKPGQQATVDQLDVISLRAPRVSLCWWGGACNLTPSRAQREYPIPGLRVTGRRRTVQFTITTLTARRPIVLTPAAVGAALRATPLFKDEIVLQRPR